jgi:thiamine kinase-like enzyme
MMTADEILELVAELRKAQRAYFKQGSTFASRQKWLPIARDLEKRVDEALKSYSEAKPTQKELRSYSQNNLDI